MNDSIPGSTYREKVEHARKWMRHQQRQQQLAAPSVRLSRLTRRIAVGCFYCLLAAMPAAYQWRLGSRLGLYLAVVFLMWAAVSFSVPAYERIGDSALDELAKTGFDPVFGARPLKRAIQSQIENPLAMEILEGRFAAKDKLKVECKNGKFVFSKT